MQSLQKCCHVPTGDVPDHEVELPGAHGTSRPVDREVDMKWMDGQTIRSIGRGDGPERQQNEPRRCGEV